jgi:uncharacterized protein (DUF433 family)
VATDVQLTDDELIEKYISADLPDNVASQARLCGSDLPVWELIRSLYHSRGNITQVANTHRVSSDAVEAALAYYLRNRRVIDARVTLHDEETHREHAEYPDLLGLVERASPSSRVGVAAREEQELIERHVGPDWYGRSGAEARLKDSGVSIWALVGYLPAVDFDPQRLAEDYNLSEEAVRAAMAFYRRNNCLLDARVAMNSADVA